MKIKQFLIAIIIAGSLFVFSEQHAANTHPAPWYANDSGISRLIPAASGLLTYWATYYGQTLFKKQSHVLPTFCSMLGAFATHVWKTRTYYKSIVAAPLLEKILYEPQAALAHINSMHEKIFTETFLAKIKELGKDHTIESAHAENTYVEQTLNNCGNVPVLIGECTSQTCRFTRAIQSRYREFFENTVTEALIEQLDSEKQTVYTSFGSGGLFQDLVILTKALAQKPDANIAIHLIDTKFGTYVDCCDMLNTSHQIFLDTQIDPTQIPLEKIRSWQDVNNLAGFSHNELMYKAITHSFSTELKIKQFLKWLTSTFSHAKIAVYVHDTASNYLEYVTKNALEYADIIVAADIEDDGSTLQYGPSNFCSLCLKTKDHKKSSKNFWLKILGKFGASILSIDVQPSKNSFEIHYKDSDNTEYIAHIQEIFCSQNPFSFIINKGLSETKQDLFTEFGAEIGLCHHQS